MTDYPREPLVSLCKLFTDGDWVESKDQSPRGIRLIQTGNVGFGKFKDRRDKARFISTSTFKRLSCEEVYPGDCLISRLPDPCGRSCIIPKVPGRLITAVDCTIARFNEKKILPKFFCYYSQASEYLNAVDQLCTGATRKRISRKNLGNIGIPLPPLPEQKQIVAILDEAFESIAKAKEIAEKNLVNAQELFDSTIANFMTPSNNTWRKTTVGDLVNEQIIEKPLDGNHGNIHPKKADFVKEGVPFIMASHLKDGEVDQHNCNFLSTKQASSLKKGFARSGDVLISHKGTIGRTAILKTDLKFVVLTPQVTYYRILDNQKLNKEFLFYFFQNPDFQDEIGDIAGRGSTRAYIGINRQLDLGIAYPDIDQQKTIASKLSIIAEKSNLLKRMYVLNLASYKELKQSILQKAFTGQLTSKKTSIPANSTSTPFAESVPDISTTDLHAGIISLAYLRHQEAPNSDGQFGHVKCEKIAHMVECLAGIDLGRNPVKDAAGPNDTPHIIKVESRAIKAGYFTVDKRSKPYRYQPKAGFEKFIKKTEECLGDRLSKVIAVIDLMVPLNLEQAEIFATTYAAWNNLLLTNQPCDDESIVTEARENWHDAKLKYDRDRFAKAIQWIRDKEIEPKGQGKFVGPKPEKKKRSKRRTTPTSA